MACCAHWSGTTVETAGSFLHGLGEARSWDSLDAAVWQVVVTAPSPQNLPTQPSAALVAQSLSRCYRLNQTACNLADGSDALGCFQLRLDLYGPAGPAGVLPTGIRRVSAGDPHIMRYEGVWGAEQLFHAPPPIGTVPLGDVAVDPVSHRRLGASGGDGLPSPERGCSPSDLRPYDEDVSSLRWERPDSYPAPVSPRLPQAVCDHLTGLLGRLMMNSVFQHLTWFQDHHPVSVLLGDLDEFKRVNDANGHQVGDEYLIRVAHALYEATPASATVYRVGGDEFAVVAPGTDEEALAELAQQVLETVAAVHTDCGVSTTITLGGTTMYAVPDGYGQELNQRELLLRRVLIAADGACNTAKSGGRNRYAFRQFS